MLTFWISLWLFICHELHVCASQLCGSVYSCVCLPNSNHLLTCFLLLSAAQEIALTGGVADFSKTGNQKQSTRRSRSRGNRLPALWNSLFTALNLLWVFFYFFLFIYLFVVLTLGSGLLIKKQNVRVSAQMQAVMTSTSSVLTELLLIMKRDFSTVFLLANIAETIKSQLFFFPFFFSFS